MDENLTESAEPDSVEMNFEALLAEAEAEVEKESQESEETEADGPGPGELSDEALEEEAEGEETEDEGEEEASEVEEPAAEESEETEDEEPEPEPEAPSELSTLREEIAELRRQLSEKKEEPKPQAPPPRKTAEQHQFEQAFYLALHGGESDTKEWESLPAHIKSDATQAARLYARAEASYALHPEQRFQAQIAPFVQQMIQEALTPLKAQSAEVKAREVLSPYLEKLSTQADKKRFAELLRDVPGHGSGDWGAEQKALSIAARLFEAERGQAAVAKKEQKADAIQRQRDATKKARKREARPGSSKSAKRKSPPPFQIGDDMAAYARTLAQGDFDLD